MVSTTQLANSYRGKRVLVTGHTGFKGAWLSEWLLALGAKVTGYSLSPPTSPALFEQLELSSRMDPRTGDILDLAALRKVIAEVRPAFIFHLAAQSLVRLSYKEPIRTYETNVIGTLNVLEAARTSGVDCTIVAVTTDKCYENKEWVHSYREEDPMGGYDPYSSSKGAAELAISSYRRSFFIGNDSKVRLASARAGNVIGGGDWAENRILPDCIRSLRAGQKIPVRNMRATRPWQHVLEPLSGYLWLAAQLATASPKSVLASGFNFGPGLASNRTVADLVVEILKRWPGAWEDRSDPSAPHEAEKLNLATDKAFHLLNWSPVWNFEETVARTTSWYRETALGQIHPLEITQRQIENYVGAARAHCVPWAAEASRT